MGSSAIEPGKDFSPIGPVLDAERLTAPFRPAVAGRIAFFFGPIAGALVSVVSLRRTGHPLRARQILRLTVAVAAVMAIIFSLLPDGLGRLFGFIAEVTFYSVYPKLQENEFAIWQTANPDIEPSNGWKALVWGFLGLLLFLVVAILIMIPLGLLLPWLF
jgi:FtsH-binding integral membrane protein